MNKRKLRLHRCEIKSGQWPGNNWGTDTDTLYLQNQKWRQVVSVMGWRMKTQKHTQNTHTYISHSGFLYTHVGKLKHCTKLKTSLVSHELKDEGIKTFHTVAYVHPCRKDWASLQYDLRCSHWSQIFGHRTYLEFVGGWEGGNQYHSLSQK